MTVSKPEVVAWMWRDINGDAQFNYMHPDGEELIRLADYERLQAETERLQAERAADKARIAELTRLLSDARADLGNWMAGYAAGDDLTTALIARIDAALAQQGEE